MSISLPIDRHPQENRQCNEGKINKCFTTASSRLLHAYSNTDEHLQYLLLYAD